MRLTILSTARIFSFAVMGLLIAGPLRVSAAGLPTLQSSNESIQLRVSGLESRTSVLEGTYGDISQSILTISGNVNKLQGSLSTLQAKVVDLSASVSDVRNNLVSNNTQLMALNNLQGSVDALNANVATLSLKSVSMQTDLLQLNDKVSTLESSLSKVKSMSIPVVVDANGTVLGGLLGYRDSNENSYTVYDPISKAIYPLDPVTGELNNGAPDVTFDGIDCTGKVYFTGSRINGAIKGGSASRFFVSNTYTTTSYLSKSLYQNGRCFNENNGQGSNRTGWLGKEVFPSFKIPAIGPLQITNS